MQMKHCPTSGRRGSDVIRMLANDPESYSRVGSLSKEVHKPSTFRHELLDFIADQLPRWRDRPERPEVSAETELTSQLAAHLTGVARHSVGWDLLQFQVEGVDEQRKSRKIDLQPRPSGTCIWIEGRRHTDFDSLLPIECKRFPIPSGINRDEREYVISQYRSTGGIQRFKAGDHGAVHSLGAMIGYVQEQTVAYWNERVASWISDLNGTESGWTMKDLLHLVREDTSLRLAVLRSSHQRTGELADIELCHLWLEMN